MACRRSATRDTADEVGAAALTDAVVLRHLRAAARALGLTLLLAALVLLTAASLAQARTTLSYVDDYDFGGQFGAGGPGMMDLHRATNTLYVVDPGNNRILKFDVSDPTHPQPANFSALNANAITQADGTPLVLAASSQVAVDNSGGPQDGTLYLATDTATNSRAYAFAATGLMLYRFAHAADGSFSVSGTPQTGRGIAVSSGGPRKGEIVRMGDTDRNMSLYTPATTPGGTPTVRVPQGVGGFGSAIDRVGGVGFSVDGSQIHAARTTTFLGTSSTDSFLFDASTLTQLGSQKFGTWGVPFDVAVSYDGTLLARKSASGGELARFRSTGIANVFQPQITGTVLIDRFGLGHAAAGMGMVESPQGYLYAADTTSGSLLIFGPGTAPDATMDDPAYVDPTTSTLRASLDLHGLQVTSCRFETGTTVGYGTNVPCQLQGSGDARTATADVAVTAGTTYHSRVVVEADNQTITFADDLTWVAPDLPTAATLPAGPQTSRGTAVLGGTVHPHKTPTGYYVEYGTDPGLASNQRFPVDQNVDAGSGDAAKRVFEVVSGLQPATTYYFRLVAETKAGVAHGGILSFRTFADPSSPQPDGCANAVFRTGPSAKLPDCRAWERVSPADKGGGQIGDGFVLSSPDGNRATFHANTVFAGAKGNSTTVPYAVERGAGGWVARGMAPPPADPIFLSAYNVGFGAFATDLSSAAGVAYNVDLRDAPGVNTAAYAWDATNDENTAIAVGGGMTSGREIKDVLMAADGRSGALAGERLPVSSGPQVPVGQPAVYWWDRTSGSSVVELASLRPDGSVDDAAAVAVQAVSTDGRRVLWQSRTGSSIDLYVGRRGAATWRVTKASNAAQPTADDSVTVEAYTKDLRYVYFSSDRPYTGDATAQANVRDLYRFDTETGALVDLTTADPNGGGASNPGAVLGVSDDGRTLYFFASGNLVSGASGNKLKLYGLRDGVLRLLTDAYQFTRNSNEALSTSFVVGRSGRGGYGTYAKVSRDGRYALMAMDGDLAGTRLESVYRNAGQRVMARYDWDTDRLDCVTCDPRGRELGAPSYQGPPLIYREAARFNGFGTPLRYLMSERGEVVFNSAHSYVDEDVNGKVDVYVWDGDLRLLTNGTADYDQWAQDASRDFKSIFVLSSEQLVAADDDRDADLYVARVNGGLADQQSRPDLASGDPCAGDGCQGPTTAAPSAPLLQSVTVFGAGNLPALPTPARATVSVTRPKAVRARSVKVKARVSGAGRVRVTGKGLRRASKTTKKAQTATVTVRVSSWGAKQLRKKKSLTVNARVTFASKAGASASKRVKLTFRQPAAKRTSKKGGR